MDTTTSHPEQPAHAAARVDLAWVSVLTRRTTTGSFIEDRLAALAGVDPLKPGEARATEPGRARVDIVYTERMLD